jgi:hypothetical protein
VYSGDASWNSTCPCSAASSLSAGAIRHGWRS